jgi:hypothetical protein
LVLPQSAHPGVCTNVDRVGGVGGRACMPGRPVAKFAANRAPHVKAGFYSDCQVCNIAGMPFRPGQKPGTINKKTLALQQAPLKVEATTENENGHKIADAMALLSAVVSREEANLALRISAASALMPYQHSRKTARYIDRPFELPAPTNVEQATENIAKLATLAAAGTIALDEMETLLGAQRAYVDAKSDTDNERRLAAIEQLLRQHPQLTAIDLEVVGGLPELAGTSILLPPRTLRIKPGNGEPGS